MFLNNDAPLRLTKKKEKKAFFFGPFSRVEFSFDEVWAHCHFLLAINFKFSLVGNWINWPNNDMFKCILVHFTVINLPEEESVATQDLGESQPRMTFCGRKYFFFFFLIWVVLVDHLFFDHLRSIFLFLNYTINIWQYSL